MARRTKTRSVHGLWKKLAHPHKTDVSYFKFAQAFEVREIREIFFSRRRKEREVEEGGKTEEAS